MAVVCRFVLPQYLAMVFNTFQELCGNCCLVRMLFFRVLSFEEIANVEKDEEELERENDFERKYNFRYEEPDEEYVRCLSLFFKKI